VIVYQSNMGKTMPETEPTIWTCPKCGETYDRQVFCDCEEDKSGEEATE
jgi:hypothetical protein